MTHAFPHLLLPHVLSSRNRARRRERGDLMRAIMFGSSSKRTPLAFIPACAALMSGTAKYRIELAWSNSGFSGRSSISRTPPQSKNASPGGALNSAFNPKTFS